LYRDKLLESYVLFVRILLQYNKIRVVDLLTRLICTESLHWAQEAQVQRIKGGKIIQKL